MLKKSMSVSRVNLNEQVAIILKDQILNLEYYPGDRLVVETLAKKINTSMTPIREGLRNLVFDGFVVYDGKSYSVFNPTKKEMMNLFSIRRVLEKVAAIQASENMEESEIDELIRYYDRKTSDLSNYSVNDFFQDDVEIHTKICQGTKNSKLINILIPLQEQNWFIRRCIFLSDYNEEIVRKTVSDHKTLLQSIKNRNSKDSEMIMGQHMDRTGKELEYHGWDLYSSEDMPISAMMEYIKKEKK